MLAAKISSCSAGESFSSAAAVQTFRVMDLIVASAYDRLVLPGKGSGRVVRAIG